MNIRLRNPIHLTQVAMGILLFMLAFPNLLYAYGEFDPASDRVDLAAVALEQGSVRVIVELVAPFEPEGAVRSKVSVERQRASIAQRQATVLDQIAPYDAELIAAWETIPFLAVMVDAAGLQALQRSPLVLDIQEDRLDAPLLDGSSVHVGAPKAWAAGYDGAGQMVVILDTGIAGAHPFFGGRVEAEACFSSSYVRDPDDPPDMDYGASLCPNGQTTQIGAGAADASATECTAGLGSGNRCWHGTHVAGIAAGANPGDVNFNGIAKGSDIGAIQVFTHFTTTDVCGSSANCLRSFTSDQISVLEYVLTDLHPNYAVASVNMSLGGKHYSDQALCDVANSARKAAIDNLRAVGIPTIIAAGNSAQRGAIAEPACISSAVAVSASTDPNDAIWGSSSIHDMVELMAPGWRVISAIPHLNLPYSWSSGTSMATPHVAGAWAVLKQQNPTASVDDVLTLLQNTGVPVTDTRSGGSVTKPRIDLCAALTELGVVSGVELNAKVLLQAAFRDMDAGTGFISGTVMRDTLRALEADDGFQGKFLPHSEPYSGQFGFGQGESIANPASTLADHGVDSIVDWIFLELRDATSPATILATRAALLQRDGDIVDVDGLSSVLFDCAMPGNYYVVVRHRNHLGIQTASPVNLAATGNTLDFTDPSIDLWHNDVAYDGYEAAALNGRSVLWGGNANGDGSIIYAAAESDSEAVNSAVLGATTNVLGSRGYRYPGYHGEDIDMDGQVIADGSSNDHALVLVNVLNHPLNPSGAQDFIIQEQLAAP